MRARSPIGYFWSVQDGRAGRAEKIELERPGRLKPRRLGPRHSRYSCMGSQPSPEVAQISTLWSWTESGAHLAAPPLPALFLAQPGRRASVEAVSAALARRPHTQDQNRQVEAQGTLHTHPAACSRLDSVAPGAAASCQAESSTNSGCRQPLAAATGRSGPSSHSHSSRGSRMDEAALGTRIATSAVPGVGFTRGGWVGKRAGTAGRQAGRLAVCCIRYAAHPRRFPSPICGAVQLTDACSSPMAAWPSPLHRTQFHSNLPPPACAAATRPTAAPRVCPPPPARLQPTAGGAPACPASCLGTKWGREACTKP